MKMKLFKFIVPVLLAVLMLLPAYAAHLPEKDHIDRELIIEPDQNIVKDSFDADKGRPEGEGDKAVAVRLSGLNYFKHVLLPFFLLVGAGCAVFALETKVRLRVGN